MQSFVHPTKTPEVAAKTVRTGEFQIIYDTITSEDLSNRELERIERAMKDEKEGNYVTAETITAYLKS